MPRGMSRRLSTLAAAASLLLCLATAGLWVRPSDPVELFRWGDPPESSGHVIWASGEGLTYQKSYSVSAALVRDSRQDTTGWDVVGLSFHRTERYATGSAGGGARSLLWTRYLLGYTIEFRISIYWLLVTTAVLPAAHLPRWLRAFRSRRAPGLCVQCGYDLRATPDRCPECGTVPQQRKAAAA
jgi:hypothetical protein